MFEPYFLVKKRDATIISFGIILAIAESLADPAATIMIGLIFKEIQRTLTGELTLMGFLHNIQKYIYGLVAITAYSAVSGTMCYVSWMSLGYTMGHRARSNLYKALLQKQIAWFDDKSHLSGRAMMHFKDIQDLEMASGITTCEILSMFFGCLVETGVAFYFSWAVTLICLAGIPVLILVGSLLSKPVTDRITKSKSLLDIISERIGWVLGALQSIKIFQREKYEWRLVSGQLVKLRTVKVGYWCLFSLQEGICRCIVLLIFMQGFYFGSYMVKHHGLNTGNVITVFWACLNASALLQALINHLMEWNKGKASAERLKKAFYFNKDEELYNSIGLAPDVSNEALSQLKKLGWNVDDYCHTYWSDSDDASSLKKTDSDSIIQSPKSAKLPIKGHVTFSDVVFSYPSRPDIVFSNLNMEFKAGETTFILGKSGCGKSSTAGLISKQYPWQVGEITIDGHDVHLLSKYWIENNVYICEQNPKIFDISLRENVKIGSRHPEEVSDEDIEKALHDSFAEFVYNLPEKLETSGSTQLSGGQQQRISIARARIRDAPITVYDEVTSGLDQDLQNAVFKRILEYRRGKTTIIITHDLSVIPEGYPVYIIEDGQAFFFKTITDVYLDSRYKDVSKAPKDSTSRPTSMDLSLQNRNFINVKTVVAKHMQTQEFSEIFVNFELLKSIPNKSLYAFGLVIASIHAIINPIFSFFFSKLIMGIIDPNASKVTKWAMLVLMCAILDGIVTFAKVTLHISAERWLLSIRMSILEKLLNYPGSKLTSDQVSYYSKMLISDLEKCGEILTNYIPGLLSMLIIGATGFIWSLIVGWKLTIVGAAILPAFVICNQLYKSLSTYWTKRREHLRAKVIRLMMDLTSERGFRTLKVQHLEKYFENIYFKREHDLKQISFPMVCQVGAGYGILKCFPYALESLLLWYGTKLIGSGTYNVQKTMTVFSLLVFTIVTIDQLTSVIGSVGTGFEALQRVICVIKGRDFDVDSYENNPISKVSGSAPEWKKISFYRVGITYGDGNTVLGDFSAEIKEGETVALIGPSGIGKSTIAKLIERLETPTTGEIVIDARYDLQTLSVYDVRQNITMVNQSPLDFFDGTIKENLLYGLDPNDISGPSRMIDVCVASGAHKFICDLKDGYDTRIKSGMLSGGQMQIIGIARALLRNPKILILDECTSALDVKSKVAVKEMINNLKMKRTMIIIIITHQLDVAAMADRIISLDS